MPENNMVNNKNTLNEKDVITYLLDNPDIFTHHPDLLTILTPPKHQMTGGVKDFQQAMISSLKNKINRTEDLAQLIISNSRDNLSSQKEIHDCVLKLLSAMSFQELVNIIISDIAAIVNLDAITFCVEDNSGDTIPIDGLQKISDGTIARLINDDKNILLRENISGDPEIFGGKAPLINSDALVLLHISPEIPAAMIAFGSRDSDHFKSDQATELLEFLTKVISELSRIWLGLSRY